MPETWIGGAATSVRAHSRGLLCCGLVLQVGVLGSMIAIHSAPLLFGERILLRVQPVDPRDYFRGDYVVLSYPFSRIPPGGIAGLPAPPPWRSYSSDAWLEDRAVYVSLEPEEDGKHFRAAGVSVDRPPNGRFLKGRFSRSGWGNDLKFGIEAFYVEEGQGLALEQMRNKSQLSAEIALAPWGQATLCALK